MNNSEVNTLHNEKKNMHTKGEMQSDCYTTYYLYKFCMKKNYTDLEIINFSR